MTNLLQLYRNSENLKLMMFKRSLSGQTKVAKLATYFDKLSNLKIKYINDVILICDVWYQYVSRWLSVTPQTIILKLKIHTIIYLNEPVSYHYMIWKLAFKLLILNFLAEFLNSSFKVKNFEKIPNFRIIFMRLWAPSADMEIYRNPQSPRVNNLSLSKHK